MSDKIKIPGKVFYLDVDTDPECRPYTAFLNDAIRQVIFDPKWGRRRTSDGADDCHEVTIGDLTLRFVDSAYGNDQYYVYVGGGCVYHCQDSSGHLYILGHFPGPWIRDLAILAG